jgi:hypothetical protein
MILKSIKFKNKDINEEIYFLKINNFHNINGLSINENVDIISHYIY